MTARELRAACAGYELAAPVTLADVEEIFADLKPHVPRDAPLDVMMIGQDRIRVTIGQGFGAPFFDICCS